MSTASQKQAAVSHSLPLVPPNPKGRINSVETCGTVDGPGIRYVIFVSGCPISCLYCHNPETRRPECSQLVTANEAVERLLRFKNFIKNGGLTIGGGEPLGQPEFIEAVFAAAKQNGLHTALDTSGALGHRASDELLSKVDLVLLDLKSFLPETYRRLVGGDVNAPLSFARRLSDMNKPMWLRHVVVPGYTDERENVKGMARFASKLKSVERVELLPFHKMGEAKYQRLGLDYELSDTKEPTDEEMHRVRSIFAEYGIDAV